MVNPDGFAFCGRCGNGLAPAAPAEQAPDPPAAEPSAAPASAPSQEPPPEHDPPTVPEPGAPEPVPAASPQSAPPDELGSAHTVYMDSGAGPAPAPAERDKPAHSARLILLGPDGQPVGERLIQNETLEVGRSVGPPWDDDAYLDERHASLTPTEEGIEIEDFESLNGIYVKLEGKAELRDGDQFRVGQELIRYYDLPEPAPHEDGTERMGSPNPGYWGRLCVLVDPETPSAAYPVAGESVTIGREGGTITFPQDGYVSGNHARIFGDDNGVYVEDLGSSNGTYMRVRSGETVPFGRLVLIGQKLFRIDPVS